MSKGLFVVGTGTDVGKTFVTALLVKALKEKGISVGYFKAALSGVSECDNSQLNDGMLVKTKANLEDDLSSMVPYIYERAVSPHLAAKIEGNPVQMQVIKDAYQKLKEKHEYIITEGSGGIICPLRYDNQVILLEDVIKELQVPVLLIAQGGLGTINATVLTVGYLKHRNIPIKGIILNQFKAGDVCHEDNKVMIESLTKVPVITCIKEGEQEVSIDIQQFSSFFQ